MSRIDHLPMPSYAHVPGQNSRPGSDELEPAIAMVLASTVDVTACDNAAWHYGVKLLNQGFFWEAHEVLETVWMNATPNSRERYLLQGVIHVANCALKVRMQRKNAAHRLSDLATVCIKRSFEQRQSPLMGVLMEDALFASRNAVEPLPIGTGVCLPLHFTD